MAYIKERGNNTYLVRISLGVDASGHAIQKSKTFHPSSPDLTKAQIKKELKAFVASLEAEGVSSSNTVSKCNNVENETKSLIPTFSEFCTTYKGAKQRSVSPTTWHLYTETIDQLLLPRFGDMRLDEIRPHHVQKFIDYLSTPDARKDGKNISLKPPTIRRYLTVLQSILTLAYKQEFINNNPADARRLELQKIVHPEVEAFDENEVKAVITAMYEEPLHIRALIAVALFTGARRGEIIGLKWDDIDFETRKLSIRRSVYKVKNQPPTEKIPKTVSSIRQMAIPQMLCDILLEYKKEQDAKIALLGSGWYHGNYIFTQEDGHVMSPYTPTRQCDHFLKRHNIRHLKLHGLRHTSATMLLANGCDIKTVSKRLGHTSIDTTNIYVHALAKADIAAADCFDAIASE